MVKFVFSFLLGIPHGSKTEQLEEVAERFNTGTTKPLAEDEKLDKNYAEYKIDKPIFSCHLEYSLAPQEESKSIDVLCWGNVAKIYGEGESTALMPLVLDKLCWIYFRVKHETNIDEENVKDYIKHNVIVTANVDGKKLGKSAQSEKAKVFYGRKKDYFEIFPTLWEDASLVESANGKEKEANFGSINTNIKTENFACKVQKILLNLTDEYSDDTIEKKPTKPEREQPHWKNLAEVAMAEPSPEPMKKAKAVKVGKAEKSKHAAQPKEDLAEGNLEETNPKTASFIIPGEFVLSGLNSLVTQMKYELEELPFFCSIVAVKNALTDQQAKYYNPLSITVKSLNFMPVDALQKESIHKIFFRYVVCDRYLAESNGSQIFTKMSLNYTRTLLTNEIEVSELLQFIQTKGLKIGIYGVRKESADESSMIKPSIYKGQEVSSKSGLAGTGTRQYSLDSKEPVLLGVANIDISSLLLQPHRLSFKYNFTCKHVNVPAVMDIPFQCTVNPTEVNTYYMLKNEYNRCHILTSSPAVMSVSIRLHTSVVDRFMSMRPFFRARGRIFITSNDPILAINILKAVQKRTQLLAPINYLKSASPIHRPLSEYHNNQYVEQDILQSLLLIGFLIDCVENILVYIEGPSCVVFQEIWSLASYLDPTRGRVLYDSSLIFTGTSHPDLIRYGGFYIVALKQPLTELLCNMKAYIEGNIPVPAYKALMQLNQLSHCRSITYAMQNDLLPDCHCLMSLDLEFGVPLKIQYP